MTKVINCTPIEIAPIASAIQELKTSTSLSSQRRMASIIISYLSSLERSYKRPALIKMELILVQQEYNLATMEETITFLLEERKIEL